MELAKIAVRVGPTDLRFNRTPRSSASKEGDKKDYDIVGRRGGIGAGV